MKNRFLVIPLVVCGSSSVCGLLAQTQTRPNVIFFLADDLGWSDLACYGSSFYETPNLDRLAQDGVLFTEAYAACPVSSPTRVSIQTGRYPVRSGVTDWIKGRWYSPSIREKMLLNSPVLPAENVFDMPLSEVTIAEALKAGGYATAHIGKWHCAESPEGWPEHQGYDVNIAGCGKGAPSGNGYYTPYNNPRISDGPKGEYLTDRLGDECVKLLHQFKEHPFFISMPFYQVHNPLVGKPEKVEYFKQKAKRMGLKEGGEFDESPDWKSKQPFTEVASYRDRLVQSNPVYAAMIASMDENIGKVIDELKRLGLYENTLLIFTSDNGGLSTSEGSPTTNRPLRTGKGHLYEGGIREPLIVKWVGGRSAGMRSSYPITSVDYYPTILEAVGVKIPNRQDLDGESFFTRFERKSSERALFWHYPHYSNQGGRPAGAIRKGNYKLIHFYDNHEIELYDVKNDIGETNDLSRTNQRKARSLLKELEQWCEKSGAKMPQKNPAFKPAR